MGLLVDGEWREDEYELTNEEGEFERSTTSFRDWIGEGYPVEPGRYHLYISRACPWAHRTAITRRLRELDEVVSLSLVEPVRRNDGWEFSQRYPDPNHDSDYLRELYARADPGYTGRVTVPVLWDKEEQTIVNNESREIMRMLDTAFEEYANDNTLLPDRLAGQVDEIIDEIYQPINNGVYRAGFAESQDAYDEAVEELFSALNHWEEVLENQRYLAGNTLTEADVCMFTTLVRFDHVYHTHFMCNKNRIKDYPNLWNYTKDIYQTDTVAETVNMDHIVQHYYGSHTDLNPKGIVPIGPSHNFNERHNRGKLQEQTTS